MDSPRTDDSAARPLLHWGSMRLLSKAVTAIAVAIRAIRRRVTAA